MIEDNRETITARSNARVLPETGLLRLSSIIGPNGFVPVSKSTWWEGVRTRRFPQPVKLGPRTTAWRAEDIRKLLDEGV